MEPEGFDSTKFENQQKYEQCYMDAHTHLLDYKQDSLPDIIKNATDHNVCNIVVNTTSSKQYNRMQQLYQSHKNLIIPGFGVHPCFIHEEIENLKNKLSLINKQGQNTEDDKKFLEQQQTNKCLQQWKLILREVLEKNQQYTVGEIGLDFRKDNLQKNPKELQMDFFTHQLYLATQLKRPATIHCVRAHGQMLKLFKNINKKLDTKSEHNLIMHSYGGSKQITKSLLKLNNLNIFFSLSLRRSEELCAVIPVEKIIGETDSPCQNNNQFLESMDWSAKNIYRQKCIQNKFINYYQQKLANHETNEPINVIANIKSLSFIYAKQSGCSQSAIMMKILQNTRRAFQLIK